MIKKRYLTLALVLSLIGINKSYAACTQEQLDAFKLVEKDHLKFSHTDSSAVYTELLLVIPQRLKALIIESFEGSPCKSTYSSPK